MEYELIECNYKVYLDILKKSNVDKHFIKTIKFIYYSIKKSHVIESYCLIRLLFEEIMYECALQIDSNYFISIRTNARIIRDFVINHREQLFGDLYDDFYFKEIYNHLSKMAHVTKLKLFVEYISKMQNSKYFMKVNLMNELITVMQILIFVSSSSSELIKITNYLLTATNKLTYSVAVLFMKNISDEEIGILNRFFDNKNDIDFINNNYQKTIDIWKEIDTPEIKKKLSSASIELLKLLKKYGYSEIYDSMSIINDRFKENIL